VVIKILEWKQILDTPDIRKIHQVRTPSLGGIPIFAGVAFALIIWLPFSGEGYNKYLFSSLSLFFVIGLRDDVIPMKAKFKLLSQMIPVIIMVTLADLKLTSFYDISNFEFNYILSICLTVFTLIVLTNSFNLIDGIDGLAGTISLISLTFFGLWFYATGHFSLSFIAVAFTGSIIAFLTYNWSPSRIFMGDTGALLIGFLLACLSVYFINMNYGLTSDSIYKFNASISTAICILIIPIVDTLRVFIIRVFSLKSPFQADNNHIHHSLIQCGLNHSKASLILGAFNIIFIGLAVVFREYSDIVLLPIILILCMSLLSLLSLSLKRIKAQTQKTSVQ
jgi:UDP-GlcNAc:undecaprenyl-phosphate GlcNAc-1-phosphate transferase